MMVYRCRYCNLLVSNTDELVCPECGWDCWVPASDKETKAFRENKLINRRMPVKVFGEYDADHN